MTEKNISWWKKAVFYQIYPRSFQDTTGNGTGDLNGIEQRLDYIQSLGVDALWISPFFCSPQKDYGYDVSDYRAVDPMFGSNEDFARLLDHAHKRGIKVIVDLVLSHTSDRHSWFQLSQSSPDNEKADWYVWADPKPDGSPPNNWQSVFGGSAWTYSTKRGQYYFHNFLKEQPDLNYNNPAVEQHAYDLLRFWLDFGVDGFRLDALHHCFCDPQLRDNPARTRYETLTQFQGKDTYSMQDHIYDCNRPEMIPFIKNIQKVVNEYEGRMVIAELSDLRKAIEYCDAPDKLNTSYCFAFLTGQPKDLKASLFKNTFDVIKKHPDYWPSWAFSNHDMIRVASRWGGYENKNNPDFTKMLLALLMSLRGTPYLYQGDELGLTDAVIPFEKIQDPWGKYLWPEWQGRDGCRTPMPWSHDRHHAGFSDAEETWLPIPQDHTENAVDLQDQDANSTLNFTRDFIRWRKGQEDLQLGDIEFLDHGEDVVVFHRGMTICVFNLRGQMAEVTLDTPLTLLRGFGLSLSDGTTLTLRPFGFGFLTRA